MREGAGMPWAATGRQPIPIVLMEQQHWKTAKRRVISIIPGSWNAAPMVLTKPLPPRLWIMRGVNEGLLALDAAVLVRSCQETEGGLDLESDICPLLEIVHSNLGRPVLTRQRARRCSTGSGMKK